MDLFRVGLVGVMRIFSMLMEAICGVMSETERRSSLEMRREILEKEESGSVSGNLCNESFSVLNGYADCRRQHQRSGVKYLFRGFATGLCIFAGNSMARQNIGKMPMIDVIPKCYS